ncbi:MAG: NAD-dependent epimerase/dehydratase family protein [Betaproteobacteria bacterium]|nr:NAD-dependent epimerase/dehydratase family protein [Betaproteobacteria bacterium]
MKVLVTGANGHLGYNLCKALLARPGYEVRASVRSLADAARTTPLRALGEIELAELDVRDPAKFDAALKGVEILFHVAATYAIVTRGADAVDAMMRDSVDGVEVALAAAAGAGVRKVVLTSSIVTLPLRRPGEPPATETDWNSDLRVPYFRAKTEAEQAAWRVARKLNLPLAAVLPGGIGGPGFQRRTPTLNLLEGIMLGMLRLGAPDLNFTYVDARDVADAHILAAQEGARGRFIVSNDISPSFMEFARVMHDIDPAVPAAPMLMPRFMNRFLPQIDALNARLIGSPRTATPEAIAAMVGRRYSVSSERARRELGWVPKFTLRESLADTLQALRALRRAEGKRRMA